MTVKLTTDCGSSPAIEYTSQSVIQSPEAGTIAS
jgi:hypothetical protein